MDPDHLPSGIRFSLCHCRGLGGVAVRVLASNLWGRRFESNVPCAIVNIFWNISSKFVHNICFISQTDTKMKNTMLLFRDPSKMALIYRIN